MSNSDSHLMRLNLGCGQFKKAGFVNVDGAYAAAADVTCDLDTFPYPFDDGAASAIEMDHALEHLQSPFEAMAECHRILAPGGRLTIRVPHFSRGMTHPDHKRGYDVSFPFYFDPSFKGGYTGTRFELKSTRLRWYAQPYLKKITLGAVAHTFGMTLGAVIDVFANLSPFAASRLWCFWVGGFEEIEFVFEKPVAPAPDPAASR